MPDEPLIILGDFNCAPDSEPYQVLLGSDRDDICLQDAARSAACNGADEGTYHAFTGQAREGRIDWILASHDFRVLSAWVDRSSFDGRYPSDHFPVWAELGLARAAVGNPRPCPAE